VSLTRLLGWFSIAVVATITFFVSACSSADAVDDAGRLRIVATTSIVGDVAAQIGGDSVDLSILLPIGIDPHTFNPTPQDVATLSAAEILFINGVELEAFIEPLLDNIEATVVIVAVSEGLELIKFGDHSGNDADPHVWLDPNNVIYWTEIIERVLRQHNPTNAEQYATNAAAYRAELDSLDDWIETELEPLEPHQRKLVTDHTSLAYFAHRYNFEIVGVIVPGYSSIAEPSAQDLAELQDAILELNAKAIFVGSTVNHTLAARLVKDTGIQLVALYTGSLSKPDGPAGTYLDYMHTMWKQSRPRYSNKANPE